MSGLSLSSDFLNYLASPKQPEDKDGSEPSQLPSLNDLSKELKISVASLREQLEVAEALGLVEVRPRTGIRRLPYSFFPAAYQSLSFAIRLNRSYFDSYAELRNQVEAAFWEPAVQSLTTPDHQDLQKLMDNAWNKLNGSPIQIPHEEHRQLHLLIYARLNNPFVQGILEAYWEAYEAVGLNLFADYQYLQEVWRYHQQMVDGIIAGDPASGYQALCLHKDLLFQHPVYSNR
jgi:DNA-binding FadR family transcriptional regulator